MADQNVLIYGAYGYSGRLIAERAHSMSLPIVLAGRRRGPLVALAAQLNVPYRAFDLSHADAVARGIEDCAVVIHCAGPFSETSAAMLEACIVTRTHYLDISGEIDVFEAAHRRHEAVVNAGIVACPGSGFDVVPTDCLALCLANALPDAVELALGFDMPGHVSPGTAKTMLKGFADGGRVRRNARITNVPLAFRTRDIDFGNGVRHAVSIPWGDVSTAFYTTGIGNISAYVPLSPRRTRQLRRLNTVRFALGWSFVQRLGRRHIERRVHGPDANTRTGATSFVWGEVRNEAGDIRTGRLQTANGYDVTVFAATTIADRLRQDHELAGVFTPARLMGAEFASTLPGSTSVVIT